MCRTNLKERERGAMGVRMEQATDGATIGPPALMEYAVEPDGVEMMRPSACGSLSVYVCVYVCNCVCVCMCVFSIVFGKCVRQHEPFECCCKVRALMAQAAREVNRHAGDGCEQACQNKRIQPSLALQLLCRKPYLLCLS
jgi:hypothetical protein